MSAFASHAAQMPAHLQARFYDIAGRALSEAIEDYASSVSVAMHQAALNATLHNDPMAAEETRTLSRVRSDVLALVNTALVNSAQTLAAEQREKPAVVVRPQDPGVA